MIETMSWRPNRWVGGMVAGRSNTGGEVVIQWQDYKPVKPNSDKYAAVLTVYAYVKEAMELAQNYRV